MNTRLSTNRKPSPTTAGGHEPADRPPIRPHRLPRVRILVGTAAVIVGALLLAAASTGSLRELLSTLGPWSGVLYIVFFIAAAVLLAPGSALNAGAGALFGLGWGTLVAWIASTGTAAVTFLISRHFARDKVARLASRNIRLAAVDQAIAEGGWRIVALLRLSPLLPYNVQNYLYGLTALRFKRYMVTSAFALLPGTFVCVYAGHLARSGLALTVSPAAAPDELQWTVLIVGFAATIAAAWYTTRLARGRLHEYHLDEADEIIAEQ